VNISLDFNFLSWTKLFCFLSFRTTENITIDGDELEELQPPKRKKTKTVRQDEDEYLEAFPEATSTIKGAFQSDEDEDDNVGRTLVAGLRKLRPANKLKARAELLAVLTKYQMKEIQEDEGNRHQPSPPQRRVVRPWTSTPKKSLKSSRRTAASPWGKLNLFTLDNSHLIMGNDYSSPPPGVLSGLGCTMLYCHATSHLQHCLRSDCLRSFHCLVVPVVRHSPALPIAGRLEQLLRFHPPYPHSQVDNNVFQHQLPESFLDNCVVQHRLML